MGFSGSSAKSSPPRKKQKLNTTEAFYELCKENQERREKYRQEKLALMAKLVNGVLEKKNEEEKDKSSEDESL